MTKIDEIRANLRLRVALVEDQAWLVGEVERLTAFLEESQKQGRRLLDMLNDRVVEVERLTKVVGQRNEEREQGAQARKERDAALQREVKALREASEATAEVKRLTGQGLGALHEAFELAEERIGAGCGDSLCRFEKARGMMTNGGCRCVDRPFVVSALAALYKEAKRVLKPGPLFARRIPPC